MAKLNITPEQFKELFINQGLTYKQMAEILGCSERQLKRLNNEKLKIRRSKEEHRKFIESYSGSLSERTKLMREAYSTTSEYSNPSLDPAIQEKRKTTFKKKYGVENPFQLEAVKEKSKETFRKKYGPGVINISQIKSAEKRKTKELKIVEKSNSSNLTEILSYLKSLNLNIKRNKKINEYNIDIYIPDLKIGVSYNKNYEESEAKQIQFYHQKKSLKALESGIFIYHIFEYEWNDPIKQKRIKSHLKHLLVPDKRRIYARNCVIKEVSKEEKSEFLNS